VQVYRIDLTNHSPGKLLANEAASGAALAGFEITSIVVDYQQSLLSGLLCGRSNGR